MNKNKMNHNTESFSQRMLASAFKRFSAKIGMAWIILLLFIASFAPFLANSAPLISYGSDTGLSFPILKLLSIEDVIVLSVFMTGMILWRLRLPSRITMGILFSVIIISSLLANRFINPPALIIYDDYRTQAASQTTNLVESPTFDWVLMPPIPYSPKDYLRDYGDTGLEIPLLHKDQRQHWMGTEENGADVMSRMIHASRIALGIGFIATGIALFIGVIIGGLMGYFSGIVDMIGMRIVEIFEAIPTLFLLLTFVAFFGRSIYMMMVIIGITSWSGYARYMRAEFLKLRKQEYVQAAIASGLPLTSILFRHMLPNGVAPLLVAASFGVASAILAEATLSFLGLGLVDAPSWGQMLNQAVQSSSFHWWMAVFPGGAIFMTVFSYNLVGEALRDAIDPQLSQKAGVS
jgi:peptide/nickel transport system permease protein